MIHFVAGARHGVTTFLYNSVYLQTIAAPTFGTNGALWSLANEFWYYLMFPLALRALVTRSALERWLSLALFAAAAFLVGEAILAYFPAWLLGVTLNVLPASRLSAPIRRLLPWLGGGVVASALVLTRVQEGLLADYILAVAVTAWLYTIAASPRAAAVTDSRQARLIVWFAAFSYTLYAVHLPLVVALRAFLGVSPGQPARWTPAAAGIALMAGVVLLALVYAWIVSRFTEARTSSVRRNLATIFRLNTTRAPEGPR